VVAGAAAGLIFGVGSALPMWWVPQEQTDWRRLPPPDWEGRGIRGGPLWEAISEALKLMHRYDQGWQRDNLMVASLLLAVSIVAGVLCYLGALLLTKPKASS
jgi:hypothetical protein